MNELINPSKFGSMSTVFASKAQSDDLGAGISGGFGTIGYKGKVWSTRYQGVETPLMRADGDGPRGSIEVILVKASPFISKTFYASGFNEDAKLAPDCQSADGIRPDASVVNKQCTTCAACPQNAWGARISESGKPGKACSDSRRVAVVPMEDIGNELLGGPMLLKVPAASLKDLKGYGDKLKALGYHYFAVATRIAFDPAQAYPKFTFGAIRPLDDAEAREVLRLQDDPRVARILNETAEHTAELPAPAAPVESIFEQPPAPKAAAPASAPAAAPKAAAPKKAPAPKPAPTPTMVTPEVEETAAAPADFDDMLDGLLK